MHQELGNGSRWSRRQFLGTAAGLAAMGIAYGKNEEKDKELPICVFSKHLQWCASFDEMAEVAAEAGFDGVDLTVRPKGHISPELADEELPKAVKAVERAGLRIPMMTTGITDPEDKCTVPILKTASKLGIGAYRMGYLSYDDPGDIPGSLDKLKPRMAALAKLNQKHRFHGAYQNHAGTRVGGPVWDLWHLMKDLDPEWMGCQYDVRHATVEGGTSWPLSMALMKDHIRITAIKDFVWTDEKGSWKPKNVPLGEGMVDFKRYFQLLKKYNIKGPISLHYEYDLGGAEHGNRNPTMNRSEIVTAMKTDLAKLRSLLSE